MSIPSIRLSLSQMSRIMSEGTSFAISAMHWSEEPAMRVV
jgi:hypothetical protein